MIYNMVTFEILGANTINGKAVHFFRKFQILTDKELQKYCPFPYGAIKRVEIPKNAIRYICGDRYPNADKLNCKLRDLLNG